eukprot:gene16199-7570_t
MSSNNSTQNNQKPRKRSQKTQSFEESLKDLDNIDLPGCSSRQSPSVVVVDVRRNCETGQFQRKQRKIYPRKKKEKPAKHREEDLASYDGDNDDVDNEYVCDEREQSTSALSDEWELEPENRDALLLNLRDIESQFPASHPEETEWTQRKRVLEENWTSARNDLFDAFLSTKSIPEGAMCCTKCKVNVAVLRCTECRKMLCSSCDETEHIIFPFHDRDTWINGFYEPVGNLVTINEGEIVLIGRYEFNEAYFFCTNCSLIISGCTVRSMLIAGYWPASPQRATTFFSLDLLRFWDSLSMNSPGTSLSSFVRSLENVSKMSGRQSSINSTAFGNAFREWKFVSSNIKFQNGNDDFVCPVCSDVCHSIHIDGHRKTYRFKKVPRGNCVSLYGDKFIANDAEVQAHMKNLYDKMGSQDYEDDKMCGSSYWQAARSKSSKSYSTLDETGLVVAGCRHVLALKGVNMFAGEQYGYALFLHQLLFGEVRMRFIWQDIMCKYWPWLEKVASKFPDKSALLDTNKALSVMHSKAHSLECQLVWGGFYQDEAALSTGESMEQFFSYFAKCGLRTKSMNASARVDALTEHAAFWNMRKIENLASTLAKQYVKAKEKINVAKQEKSELLKTATSRPDDTLIKTWETEFRSKARASFDRQSSSTVVNQLAEYFKLHQEVSTAPVLQEFVERNDKACSIMSGQEELYTIVAARQVDTARLVRKMENLEKKLLAGGYDKETALRDGKGHLAERTLELLRTRIVHTYLNIQQQKHDISRVSDTSKRRTKIRKALGKNVKLLEKTVEKYNVVVNLTNGPNPLKLDAVSSGIFAWQEYKEQSNTPEWLRKQIVDKNVLLKRCKEELFLLVEEMQAYCTFFKNKIQYLEEERLKLGKCIEDIENGETEVAALKRLQWKVAGQQNREEIDKLLGDGSTILKLKGIQSLKQEGISLCKKRLTTAADVFKKALGADFEMHFKEDDVEEGRSETEEEDDPEETPDDDFHENDFVMDSVLNSSLV